MRPDPKQLRAWYRRAQKLDPSIMLDDRFYTFPGGHDEPNGTNRHQAHRSLHDFGDLIYEHQIGLGGTEENGGVRLWDTGAAQFWRQVGRHVHDLPKRYPHRAFLVRVCETGNVLGSSSKSRLSPKVGRKVWRKFVVEVCGLADPDPTYLGHEAASPRPEPQPAPPPCRRLSKAEIKKLNYTPPKKLT